jgi:hypothetical protein
MGGKKLAELGFMGFCGGRSFEKKKRSLRGSNP